MCGIAGIFNYKSLAPPCIDTLKRILLSIQYRGPDHTGIFEENVIALGNARLSIIGLSESGNQPIYNEDHSVVVVYNGEIYNYLELKTDLEQKGHVFSSSTDTELFVHLYEEWGESLAQHLNGMFAFALYDRKKEKLILGRDRTGQKPLYYSFTANGILFCSELKALIPFLPDKALDFESIRVFLSMGYTLEPSTILQAVSTLVPGCIFSISQNSTHQKVFWKVPENPTILFKNYEDWRERALELFPKAFKRHLLSDVPIALFLSGGVDSSTIASILAREKKVSAAFTGSFSDTFDHDEFFYAADLADHFGVKISRVDLSRTKLANHLEEFLSSSSFPQGDYSGLSMYVLAKETAKTFRVVLGGDGGDELFGGYPTYSLPFLQKMFFWVPLPFWRLSQSALSAFSKESYMSFPFMAQQLAQAWGHSTLSAHFQIKNFLPFSLAAKILLNPKENEFLENMPRSFANLGESIILDSQEKNLCWLDFRTFLLSATIPKGERNCMKHSLELRLPFLDNQILDFSLATAPEVFLGGMQTKSCLKRLLKEIRPMGVRGNPQKQGFSPPLVSLFRNELKEWRNHWLHSPNPFLKKSFPKLMEKWEHGGWDLHRLDWNISVLADFCFRNGLG